jgi:hypothetical protein
MQNDHNHQSRFHSLPRAHITLPAGLRLLTRKRRGYSSALSQVNALQQKSQAI